MQFWKLYYYSTYQVPFKDFSKDLIPFLDVSDEEGVEIMDIEDVSVPTLGKASENMNFFIIFYAFFSHFYAPFCTFCTVLYK